MQAFEYFTKQSNFGTVEKYTTYLAGPVVMYFVGKHVKNKYAFFALFYSFPSTYYNKTDDFFFHASQKFQITQQWTLDKKGIFVNFIISWSFEVKL